MIQSISRLGFERPAWLQPKEDLDLVDGRQVLALRLLEGVGSPRPLLVVDPFDLRRLCHVSQPDVTEVRDKERDHRVSRCVEHRRLLQGLARQVILVAVPLVRDLRRTIFFSCRNFCLVPRRYSQQRSSCISSWRSPISLHRISS
jgi:hypothetical protein